MADYGLGTLPSTLSAAAFTAAGSRQFLSNRLIHRRDCRADGDQSPARWEAWPSMWGMR